jgi:hydroxymethylpyrimidine pyrophosphatase-like HAD family hydrolase
MKRFQRSLPKEVAQVVVNSEFEGLLGAIYCLTYSILLSADLAIVKGTNPGKPEVPEWGKKIHSLRLSSNDLKNINLLNSPTSCNLNYKNMSLKFSGLIMDLDGTVVDTDLRFDPINNEIIELFEKLLSIGLKIGFSTGRGNSAIDLLRGQINKEFWDEILIGLYSGTLLTNLRIGMDQLSRIWPTQNLVLEVIERITNGINGLHISVNPTQISIRGLTNSQKDYVNSQLLTELGQCSKFIKVQRSGHSLDVLPHWASKLSVVELMKEKITGDILCIGDQGQFGGNDEELLTWTPSISVGSKRPMSNDCLWVGRLEKFREASGTLSILKSINFIDGAFTIDREMLFNNFT